MYYSAGTYESFAHPEKPEGVDKKSAYIIGTGLAGLTAAFYLVRDGQMKGAHIHLLEKLELAKRQRSEVDRRVIYVAATDKYRALRGQAKTDVVSYFTALMAEMPGEDQLLVATALQKLDEALSRQGGLEE